MTTEEFRDGEFERLINEVGDSIEEEEGKIKDIVLRRLLREAAIEDSKRRIAALKHRKACLETAYEEYKVRMTKRRPQ